MGAALPPPSPVLIIFNVRNKKINDGPVNIDDLRKELFNDKEALEYIRVDYFEDETFDPDEPATFTETMAYFEEFYDDKSYRLAIEFINQMGNEYDTSEEGSEYPILSDENKNMMIGIHRDLFHESDGRSDFLWEYVDPFVWEF